MSKRIRRWSLVAVSLALMGTGASQAAPGLWRGASPLTPMSEPAPTCCWTEPDCAELPGYTVECILVGEKCNPTTDKYCHYTKLPE